jgi:hypothetical protein
MGASKYYIKGLNWGNWTKEITQGPMHLERKGLSLESFVLRTLRFVGQLDAYG